jgi:predicted nucleic-acid-binding Zn-ribbon protein
MNEQKCEVDACSATLSSPLTIAMGLCDRHSKMLDGPQHYYYYVVCQDCTNLHAIKRAPFQGDPKNEERYIMIKSCPKCNEHWVDEEWLNHPKGDDLSKVVLSKGKTILNTRMQTGRPRSISLIKPRAMATGAPQEKHDVIGKIKISQEEADKRLNQFLSNLDLGDQDHGH